MLGKTLPHIVEAELKLYGITLLKPYVHSETPLVYICTCGGIGRSILGSLRKGKRCGHCTENKWIDLFSSFGVEVIKYNNAGNIEIRCSCGNIETVYRPNDWLTSYKGCKQCRQYIDYRPLVISTKPKRPGLFYWRQAVFAKDNFACVKCDLEYDLQAHHIESFSSRPELVLDLNNGITLCYDCHKELHSKYGFQVGLDNLNHELNL